jgi:hypothetical protein
MGAAWESPALRRRDRRNRVKAVENESYPPIVSLEAGDLLRDRGSRSAWIATRKVAFLSIVTERVRGNSSRAAKLRGEQEHGGHTHNRPAASLGEHNGATKPKVAGLP